MPCTRGSSPTEGTREIEGVLLTLDSADDLRINFASCVQGGGEGGEQGIYQFVKQAEI